MAGLADASIMSMIENPDPNQRGKLLIAFSVDAVLSQDLSNKAGRPIYEDKEMIRIFTPGDRDNVIHTEVNDIHKRRYSAEYAKWKAGRQDAEFGTGTPLKLLPGVLPSQVAELSHFHVRTIENLAGMSDVNAQRVGPITELRQRAKDYLAQAAGMAPIAALRDELKSKDSELDAVKRQLKELGDRFEKSMKERGETQPRKAS